VLAVRSAEPSSIEEAAKALCAANYRFHKHPEPGTMGWVRVRAELDQAWRDLQGLVSAAEALEEVEAGGWLYSLDEVLG
jgi:hypothetical protein